MDLNKFRELNANDEKLAKSILVKYENKTDHYADQEYSVEFLILAMDEYHQSQLPGVEEILPILKRLAHYVLVAEVSSVEELDDEGYESTITAIHSLMTEEEFNVDVWDWVVTKGGGVIRQITNDDMPDLPYEEIARKATIEDVAEMFKSKLEEERLAYNDKHGITGLDHIFESTPKEGNKPEQVKQFLKATTGRSDAAMADPWEFQSLEDLVEFMLQWEMQYTTPPSVEMIVQIMKSTEEQMVADDEDVSVDEVRNETAETIVKLMKGGEG